MYTEWTHHLSTPEEKEAFTNSILGSKRVLDRLKAIIEMREEQVDRHDMNVKSFETPNWAYKQAFNLGLRLGLSITKKYIDLDGQQEPSFNGNESTKR